MNKHVGSSSLNSDSNVIFHSVINSDRDKKKYKIVLISSHTFHTGRSSGFYVWLVSVHTGKEKRPTSHELMS